MQSQAEKAERNVHRNKLNCPEEMPIAIFKQMDLLDMGNFTCIIRAASNSKLLWRAFESETHSLCSSRRLSSLYSRTLSLHHKQSIHFTYYCQFVPST
jgi:hypothetical protein